MEIQNTFFKCGLVLIALFTLLQGCDTNTNDDPIQQEQENQEKEGTINIEFKTFVESFVTEMNQRGLSLSSNNLSVVFVDRITAVNGQQFCAYGYANFQNSGNQRVEIIEAERCWGSRSEIEKENLMFHELGHALLAKGHTNGTLPNGSQLSLMCGSKTCNNYRVYNIHHEEQRLYYLDQLADDKTEIPDWASEKVFSRTLLEDSFDNDLEGWSSEVGDDTNNEKPYDFYIEDVNAFSLPNALIVESTSNSSMGTFGHWQKTLTISEFEDCSNILVRVDIVTEGLVEGSIGIAIDLLERNTEGELEFFARYSNALNDTGADLVTSENFEAHIICLPKETEGIIVKLYMNGVPEGTVAAFDNLEIELFE